MLTQMELKSLLHYNEETGEFLWLVSRGSRASVGSVARNISKQSGYVIITINKKSYHAHRLAWLYVYGYDPPEYIDHINGVRYDNRINNIRLATRTENNRNVRKQSNNTSGLKGVSWHKQNKKWRATCTVNGKQHHLGLFLTKEEASAAYMTFAKLNHGEFYNSGENI